MPLDIGLPSLIPDPDLVLDRRHHLVAEIGDVVHDRPEHLAGGELARGAVRPARGGQAHAPARPPGKVADRVGIGVHDQVGGAGADAEVLVVGDRRVHRVQPQDQVRHHRPMCERPIRTRGAGEPFPRIAPFMSGIPRSTNSSPGLEWRSRRRSPRRPRRVLREGALDRALHDLEGRCEPIDHLRRARRPCSRRRGPEASGPPRSRRPEGGST